MPKTLLGSGISGSVTLHDGRTPYVVKRYHSKEPHESTKEYRVRVLHEYNTLKNLDHPNIIRVFSYSAHFHTVKVKMEAGGPDMAVYLRKNKLSDSQAMAYFKQVCNGVCYVHRKGICHRDLKPQNLVLDSQGVVRIIDWCTASDQEECVGLVGSESFAAPEQFSSIRYNGKMADLWSLGILLVYFRKGTYPWKSAHVSDEKFREYSNSGAMFSELEQSILEVDPKRRPTVEEVCRNIREIT